MLSSITKKGEIVRKIDPMPIYFGFWCLMTNTTKLDKWICKWLFCSSIGCKTWLGRRRCDDPMINTLSKTLEAQEKIQDIKQSPSTKIGTKLDARSRRNELIVVTGRWKVIDRTLRSRGSATAAVSSSDRTLNSNVTGRTDGTVHRPSNTFSTDRTLVANRPDVGL